MNEPQEYYTLKGYQNNEHTALTAAMEDYLEMICRIYNSGKPVRTVELSKILHVKPSSVTKMIQHLTDGGFIFSRKYGCVVPTQSGKAEGEYLLKRHKILTDFFCALNGNGNELEQVEKTEHFFSKKSIENLEKWTEIMQSIKRSTED